ncbi:hypothetical protein BV20DRAFT_937410 [Pilatotrama ljubarskyi]|nr:hypothetical protein BV20DRAFT_937410 [Pilatotrama ljubarskyi]
MPAGKAATAVAAAAAERSDDDSAAAEPSGSGHGKSQRSAKACDRCRKSKSKCEPSPADGEPCKSCAATGAVCTYTAPSFRRGPPKGYIQALEHRLHQVESVLAAIMSSTDVRSRSIVDALSKDELAAHILETVDAGPFGKTGRQKRAIDTSKDNFFSSIVAEKPKPQSHRSRRESRATRENVIENVIARDPQIQTTRPTLLWQDRLSERLARSFGAPSSSAQSRRTSVTPGADAGRDEASGSEPPRMKRRLDGPSPDLVQLVSPYSRQSQAPSRASPEEAEDDLEDCADAFGNLSIDENREVRYHGNASGLHLLVQAERNDGRNIQGIWQFPMAKFWPGPGPDGSLFVEETGARIEFNIRMPPPHVQDRLIEVYFTYVNTAVPVVDEESFMAQYKAMWVPYSDIDHSSNAPPVNAEVRPEHPQKLSKLLLFAMFAYAATHMDPLDRIAATAGSAAEREAARAEDYAACARRILDTMYHESRTSTVQALILLGMREYGIGTLEEGWLHIGKLYLEHRLALDLGLNRNPDKWMHNGRELFTEQEKVIRKRIWWACCLAEKFSALFLGRTIAVHEGDFSTPLLEVPADDAEQMWQPCPVDPRYGTVAPVPAVRIGYLRHISSLYVITGEILANVYRVSRAHTVPSRALRQQLYSRLLQWALELPDHLNYSVKSARPSPAPHVLVMHIQYWASVLLLHRPFIPKGAELARGNSPSLDPDPVPWESYDICQGAASQVASFAMLYHEKYDMRWAPPFVANCLQAAGYLAYTVKYKPLDTQASVGLQKCIAALAGMEATWVSALRVRHLIQNAKVNIDEAYASATGSDSRQKRRAQVAFDPDPMYDMHTRPPPVAAPAVPQAYGRMSQYPPPSAQAHALLHRTQPPQHAHQAYQMHESIPGDIPPLPDYIPGYDSWWPVLEQHGDAGNSGMTPGIPESAPLDGTGTDGPGMAGSPGSTGLPHGLPSQDFTFNQQHFSPEFLQAMRDPIIHFPSVFAHQY